MTYPKSLTHLQFTQAITLANIVKEYVYVINKNQAERKERRQRIVCIDSC